MTPVSCDTVVLRGISTSFDALSPCERQVAHALLTRPPLEYLGASSSMSPLDLHVLGTPPAFVLSQDQTLAFDSVLNPEVSFKFKTHFRIDCLFSMRLVKIASRVLLDSVSFSRIIAAFSVPLSRCLARGDLMYYTRLDDPCQHLFSLFPFSFCSFSATSGFQNDCLCARLAPIHAMCYNTL